MPHQFESAVMDAIRRLQDRVEETGDKTQLQLNDLNITVVKQEENLRLHMYRTELAENRLELIELDVKPLKTYVAVAKGLFVVVGMIATAVGLITGILEIISHLV